MKLFLLFYFAVFFLTAFVWRSYLVWKRTGVNPYQLGTTDSAHDFVGRLFRLTMIVVVVIVVTYAASGSAYQFLTPILWLGHPLLTLVGAVLLVLALVWMLIAQAQMGNAWRIGIDADAKTDLVQTGLFAVSRNPIFLSMLVMLLGLFLVLPSAASLAVNVLGAALIHIQVRLEEEHLTRLHGEAYRVYCRRVRRWL